MASINVAEIEAGMILAKDLKDQNGRFLLGKGVELTSKHLKIMKTWGVVEAEIEGVSEEDVDAKRSAQLDPEILSRAEKITRKRFMHTNLKHEAIRQLFQISVMKKAEEISRKAATENEVDAEPLLADSAGTPSKETTEIEPDLRNLIRDKMKLPSLPIIFHQINEAISDPRCSATHIANIISKDSSLSARLLKLVNSAFYNFPSKIETISRAIAIIGTKQLSTLSLGTCALTVFKDVPSELINMKSFWKHSIACGIIARIISSYKNNSLTERFFVAGILHDIGRLIILQSFPTLAKKALLKAKHTNSLLYETEEAVMGFNHARIGGILLKEWKLPMVLEKAVRFHHNHQQSQIQLDTAVIHLSDVITNALDIGSGGERLVPPLDRNAWREIGISTHILDATVKQAEHHIQETAQIFFPNET